MELKRLILEKIAELGEVMLDGFFPAKYPEVRLWRGLLGRGSSYRFFRPTFSTTRFKHRVFVLWKPPAKTGRQKTERLVFCRGDCCIEFWNAKSVACSGDSSRGSFLACVWRVFDESEKILA